MVLLERYWTSISFGSPSSSSINLQVAVDCCLDRGTVIFSTPVLIVVLSYVTDIPLSPQRVPASIKDFKFQMERIVLNFDKNDPSFTKFESKIKLHF